jgi:hypothetical protein
MNVEGFRVVMSDGWTGKVEMDCGGLVACLADGELPDLHWHGDYRIFGRPTQRVRRIYGFLLVRWTPLPGVPRSEPEVAELRREKWFEPRWANADPVLW